MKQFITVEKYNIQWESEFCKLQTLINNVMGEFILSIEHVGSTSIKDLASKPILDVDVVIEDYDVFPKVIKRLEHIGYFHQEEWSFKGREAFGRKDQYVPWDGKHTIWMEHHLYVFDKNSEELRRHVAFRDYLRGNPDLTIEYEKLKKELAETAESRASYSLGKTEFIEYVLEKAMKNR
ncbi:GrpB family protein [Bacillus proteolyticus]|uniref:GrpB family protein n=1 Tax=Bacillus proteolyticus TaxID=2026192 RepID=UPI003D063062